jgi:hypothetical protein
MKCKNKPDEFTLSDLYLNQRLTTRAIGKIYGYSKTEVRRWLMTSGIQLRPANRGLIHRGIEPPTADQLQQMIHVEHLTYEQVAAKYGADFTTVPHWLKKHGIEKPKPWITRNKGPLAPLPPLALVQAMYEKGATLQSLADQFSVSEHRISAYLKDAGIELRRGGFDGGKRYICDDHSLVMSAYEQKAANWLIGHSVPFVYEPRLPFNRRLKADFQANGWFIEIWGVQDSASYEKKRKRKLALYETYRIPLIELLPSHFSVRKHIFESRMRLCLYVPAQELPLFQAKDFLDS